MSTEGRTPRFSLLLHRPDGTERSRVLSLGDTLYGTWRVKEYNPMHQTVTIANENRILILRRGLRTSLDARF